MACVNVIAADSDSEAEYLATSFYQLALGLFRKDRRPLPAPVDSMEGVWTEAEELGVLQMMEYSFIGNATTVSASLQSFLDKTGVDEIMVASHVFGLPAKMRSLELTASLFLTEPKMIGADKS